MSEQTLNVKILLRNDTSANWKTKNPILENGELGIETDTRLMKFGDGTSTWTNLNYIDAQIANNVAWSGVTDKPSTYPPADHNHDSSYPSITGDRASGTWGINISGNAASSTNADTVDGKHASDFVLAANVYDNAGAHNAIFRGKDITANFKSGTFSTAVSNGTFTDIYPGDYIQMPITINGTTTTYNIIIGDCDYHLHRGDTETTVHHVLAFTRVHIGNEHMNATNTTAGGYISSDMWKTILPKYTTAIKNAFGSSHILTHRELLSNAESDTVSSAAGAGWSGGTTDCGWYNVDVNLFNEPMVYGCRSFSSSGFDIGDCDTQVAAMKHDKTLSFTRTYWCWLRTVVSSSYFARADSSGLAYYSSASIGDGGVRPYFLLY